MQKRLAGAGALLFGVGLATGAWAAVVLTEQITVPIPRLALAAHLNGLLGGLWLIAVAGTLGFLRYGERGTRRLAWLVAIPAWSNWLLTLVASCLGVRGLTYTGDLSNDAVTLLLEVFVVLPALVGAGVWVWGFGEPREMSH